MFGFEKLDVWQRVRKFVNKIYEVTNSYPEKELFGLTLHTRKSAVSILSNIAEGTSRFSKQDARRFIEIAIGSLYEAITQLYIALDNRYLKEETFKELYAEGEVIGKMLSNLHKSKASSP